MHVLHEAAHPTPCTPVEQESMPSLVVMLCGTRCASLATSPHRPFDKSLPTRHFSPLRLELQHSEYLVQKP